MHGAALRQGASPTGTLCARDSSGLASDYAALTAEIFIRITELEQEYVDAS